MSEFNICTLDENNIIEKSKPLLLAKKIPYSLAQFKLLETYLSLINPRDLETTRRVFKLRDYENLLGVDRMKMENLRENLSGLMTIQITIPYDGYKSGFMITNLFETAEVINDDRYGWLIVMRCSKTAQEILFDIKDLSYLKYILRNIIFMNSTYSMLLYQYLRNNMFRNSWSVPTRTLRKDHLWATSSTYSDFMRFNEMVLKPSLLEVNEKTDLIAKYETIFTNGKVQDIRFMVSEKKDDFVDHI